MKNFGKFLAPEIMKVKTPPENAIFEGYKPSAEAYEKLQRLTQSLKSHRLPEDVIVEINEKMEQLSAATGTRKELLFLLQKTEKSILDLVRKRSGLIPENYYTYLWMPVGMAGFGLPLGAFVFALTDNPAFIGIGLPLGIGMGGLLGAMLDNKAKKENKVI